MNVKYARSIRATSFFFKRNICKGEHSTQRSADRSGRGYEKEGNGCHTPHAICPENMIKPMKAFPISQKFYDYAD